MTPETPRYALFGHKLHQLVSICAAIEDIPIQEIESEIGSLCKRQERISASPSKSSKSEVDRAGGYIRNLYRGNNLAGTSKTLDDNLKQMAKQFHKRLSPYLREGYLKRLIYNLLRHGDYSRPDELCEELFGVDAAYLVGVEHHIHELSRKLRARTPNIVLLSGIGNTGKTTVAQRTASVLEETDLYEKIISIACDILNPQVEQSIIPQIIDKIAGDIGYQQLLLGAPQDEQIDRIRHYLDAKPTLLIIDNLEGLHDTLETLALVKRWGRRSSFLIISHCGLDELKAEDRGFISHKLMPLSRAEASELMNAEMARFKRPPLAPSDLEKLYDMTGGIPGLLRLMNRLIDNGEVSSARTWDAQQNLVHFAYGRIWNHLSPQARTIVMTMTFVSPHGESEAAIQELCVLVPREFSTAWRELKNYSLIQHSKHQGKVVYFLHQTLMVFLRHREETSTWFYRDVPRLLNRIRAMRMSSSLISHLTLLMFCLRHMPIHLFIPIWLLSFTA